MSKSRTDEVRQVEKALGEVNFGLSDKTKRSRVFARSLFVVKDMHAGEKFTEETIRSIRPSYGLPPKFLKEIIGKKASKDIERGTPLDWTLIE